jgi:6-phosphofructokinase
MKTTPRRIAINSGGGYVPGLNAVVTGAVLAAAQLGMEIVGIRDGYDGLLDDQHYPQGGLVTLTPQVVENLASGGGSILGTAARYDPFRVRTINDDDFVEEVDRSDSFSSGSVPRESTPSYRSSEAVPSPAHTRSASHSS